MKRFLAVLLCLCMLLPATVSFAASEASKQTYSTDSKSGEIIFDEPILTGDGWKDSTLSYSHKWTNAKGAMATYEIKGIKAGNYEAYFWLIPNKNDAPQINIYVDHNGKTSMGTLYQKLEEDETVEAGWVSFGVFDFAKDGDQKIYTPCEDGNIRATKMKLVPTKAAVTGTGDAKYEGATSTTTTPATTPSASATGNNIAVDNTKYDGEVIFHYKDAELNGNWADSTTLKNFDGGSQAWNQTKGDTIKYTIDGIEKGNYEVFYYNIYHVGNVEKTPFTVVHNGKTDTLEAITKPDAGGPLENGWISMGILDFAGTGDETVTLTHPGGGHARGSGIKLVPTDKDVYIPSAEANTDVKEEESNVSSEGVPVIGDKKPNPDSQLKDITVKPMGKCTWEGAENELGVFKEWTFSGAVLGPMKDCASSMWISDVDEKATVTYNPEIEAVGDVNIFVYLLWWKENQNPNVKYEIYHNGKVDTVMLDPTTLTESSWVYLGTFDFAGKPEEEYVKLVCQKSSDPIHNTRASTVMFEIVNSANGDIWQTRYVTPAQTNESVLETANLATLDKFADMVGHWANYDVEYMANEGLVSGVSENTFNPDAQITRAEYLTILDRAMGYEEVKEDFFADVTADSWYYGYVGAAKKNGLIEGLPTDDGFNPTEAITREEMALFTYNAIKATGKNDEWLASMPDDFAKFTDTAEISPWATDAMQYLVKTGIIKGMTETTAAPKGNATRAQGAVILKRFMQMFVWAGPPVGEDWVLTFNDEFNGTEIDWGVWRSDASAPGHILSSRWPENVEVHDGALHLVVRKEERGGMQWTAGSVWVRPEVFAQTYGYWEARYKYTAAPGINNSFWTYVPHGHNIHMDPDETTWYELDITEGHYPNKVNMNYHTWVTGERKQHSESYASPYDLSADYHTYALEWTPTELKYYHDGKLLRVQENYNAHQLQFPYLSSAVLNWAGAITNEADGTAQIVDYVRIWQKRADLENPELNYRGEPMVGVGPSEQGPSASKPAVDENGVEIPNVTLKDQAIDNAEYPGEIIIPAVVEGNWSESTAITNYDGKAHKWTNVSGADSKYPLADVAKGEYKVYMWRLPHIYNIGQMNIYLNQDGEKAYFGSLALKLADGEKADPGWVEIGTLSATGDKDAFFQYTCEGTNCRATAVKLVPVK